MLRLAKYFSTASICRRDLARCVVTMLVVSSMTTSALADNEGYLIGPTLGVSDKTQAKLWHHDGSWWGAFNGANHIGLYQLVDSTQTWTEIDSVGPGVEPHLKGGTTDVFWDGNSVYIAAYDTAQAPLYKYDYNPLLKVYTKAPGFPVSIPTGPNSETISITKDSVGRLWAAVVVNLDVLVYRTTTSDKNWTGPDTLGTFVDLDDVCNVHAWDGKVGVMWSNQSDDAYYFRYRQDWWNPNNGIWTAAETVLEGVGKADDHISIAHDNSGRLFVGLKDKIDKILVARRNVDGTWDANTDVLYGRYGTRPQVLVDNSEDKIYCFYTRWPNGTNLGHNWIEYRVADANNLTFGVETLFIHRDDASMNNIQSTVQEISPGAIVAICDADDGNAYWNGWGPISGVGGSGGGGPLPSPPPAPGIASSSIQSSPGASLGMLAYNFDEGSGSVTDDASPNDYLGVLGDLGCCDSAEPEWTSGVSGPGLYFNGINDYVWTHHRASLAITGSFTLECWIRLALEPDKMGLINKGATNTRNYRLMLGSGGNVELSFKDAGGSEYEVVSVDAITDQEWHHVAGVYDADANELRVYLDGTLSGSANAAATPVTGEDHVLIGARETSTIKDYFFGSIDLVRISDEAIYDANFGPPVAFSPEPNNYVNLEWEAPDAEGGVDGYNVFRSINNGPWERLNGFILVSTNKYTDASVIDGTVQYRTSAVDQLGQEGPQSEIHTMGFESYVPMLPTIPRNASIQTISGGGGGIIAGYLLDEGSGQDVLDGSGNTLHGFLGNSLDPDSEDPTWSSGMFGGALQFDGSDDCVTIPDNQALRIAGSMTIQTWFQMGTLGERMALINKGTSSRRNYRLRVGSSGEIDFSFAGEDGDTRTIKSDDDVVTDTNWHHVAAVYDSEQGEMRLYYDGNLVATESESGTPETTSDDLYLGTRQSSSSLKDHFAGKLDLISISPGVAYTDDFTPPTALSGGSGDGVNVSLTWTIPEYGLIAGYNVYRVIDGGFLWKLNRNGLWSGTSITDDSPHPGENCYWVAPVNAQGQEGTPTETVCFTFTADEVPTDSERLPNSPHIELQVVPNPFNPTARIHFNMVEAGRAEFEIFDVLGRRVREWHAQLPVGRHAIAIPQHNHKTLSSGVYFLKVRTPVEVAKKRLVLLK